MQTRQLTDGQRLRLIDIGTGVPLVFVHGLPGQGADFEPCMLELSDGCRCIAYDRVGYGESSPVQPDREPGIGASADELIEVLDLLNLPSAILIGWSYGGHIVLDAAQRFPDRVSSLVLIGAPGPTFNWPGNLENRLLFHTPVGGPIVRGLHMLGPEFFRSKLDAAYGSRVPEEDIESFWNLLGCPGTIDRWLMEGRIWRPSSSPASSVDHPCLIIQGTEDTRVPAEEAGHLHSIMKNSKLHLLPGAGHWPFRTHVNVVVKSIREFLSPV